MENPDTICCTNALFRLRLVESKFSCVPTEVILLPVLARGFSLAKSPHLAFISMHCLARDLQLPSFAPRPLETGVRLA